MIYVVFTAAAFVVLLGAWIGAGKLDSYEQWLEKQERS